MRTFIKILLLAGLTLAVAVIVFLYVVGVYYTIGAWIDLFKNFNVLSLITWIALTFLYGFTGVIVAQKIINFYKDIWNG